MSVYYFLSRLTSPVITCLFYFYSLLTNTRRARVVAKNENGEILLLQAWPDTSIWNLPGGGLERDERPEEAAARELHEEAGIDVAASAMQSGVTIRNYGHEEVVFRVTVPSDSLPAAPPNRWEVRQARWFSLDSLPKVSSDTRRIIAEVAGQR